MHSCWQLSGFFNFLVFLSLMPRQLWYAQELLLVAFAKVRLVNAKLQSPVLPCKQFLVQANLEIVIQNCVAKLLHYFNGFHLNFSLQAICAIGKNGVFMVDNLHVIWEDLFHDFQKLVFANWNKEFLDSISMAHPFCGKDFSMGLNSALENLLLFVWIFWRRLRSWYQGRPSQ